MDEWDELSLNELRGLVKRLYVRLEQYEIHAGSLSEDSGARGREGPGRSDA